MGKVYNLGPCLCQRNHESIKIKRFLPIHLCFLNLFLHFFCFLFFGFVFCASPHLAFCYLFLLLSLLAFHLVLVLVDLCLASLFILCCYCLLFVHSLHCY